MQPLPIRLLTVFAVLPLLTTVPSCQTAAPPRPTPGGPTKVEIRKTDDSYRLYVRGEPFYIKGAGLEFGNQEKLAEHGGNSFRTWCTENGRETGRQVLDRAMKNGLFVTMGLAVAAERHGFDYNNTASVAAQLADLEQQVRRHKDHPALLFWAIGNELNLNAKNPKVWDAVNEISKMIHRIDPNHPTLTTLAGIGPDLIREIKARATDLDLIGIQMYADIVNLPRYLRETGWTGPYIVTEWGATGHWEVGKTAWGAPIENDSTTKAEFYQKRHDAVILVDRKQCLGSYVFLWGQKQERTPTWYGLFLESGEETAAVDVMHRIWNGTRPANCSPRLEGVWLEGKTAGQNIRVTPGQRCTARVQVRDEDNDPVTYRWEILEESTDLKSGGDAESKPRTVTGLIEDPAKAQTHLKAPAQPGAYRLFVYAFDGKGHAAHANIPFLVVPPNE
ncbi:MAG TPA: glycoside hydrolase family 2 TIM barrel-domain containing protein [Verrucomicrobiota bacterium]|nr:glycoside hydrolase family 2 TIM barrel-domain containing protein [Verrucomicrobiota bacterium]HNU53021.1 glycoside hydrolase family 2 TIM barrel-domain containing protein [Verrucomicrobiota bacterium]